MIRTKPKVDVNVKLMEDQPAIVQGGRIEGH